MYVLLTYGISTEFYFRNKDNRRNLSGIPRQISNPLERAETKKEKRKMNKIERIIRQITSAAMVFILMLGVVAVPFFSNVETGFAQDEAVPSEEPAPVEETSNDLTSQPVVEEVVVEEAVVEEVLVEEAVVEEVLVEEVVVEEAVVEEAVVEEELLDDGAAPLEDPEPAGEEQTEVDIEQVVETLAESGLVLVDEDQEPISLASTEAVELLSAPDPYFTRGGVIYRFLTDCSAYPTNCTVSSNPIQAAIDDVEANGLPDDGVIIVEPGTYEENVTISVSGLTLYGSPGDLLLAGAASDAPTLLGGFTGDTGVGVHILGNDVNLIGFIIEGYDTGVLVDGSSGNIDVWIENNTIKNNVRGIKSIGETGKPNLEVHYNRFENNTWAIDNNSTVANSNNVQFIEAQNNDWGCSEGPIVNHSGTYYYWNNASDTVGYSTNPNPDCGILYGIDPLWDLQKSGNAPKTSPGYWSPYKININTLADPEVLGCTDDSAENYNPDATSDDGSCEYIVSEPPGDPGTTGDPGTSGQAIVDNSLIPVTGADLGMQALLPAGGILLVGVSFIVRGLLGKKRK
jgi:hypothetical protein